jgi:hypothetical protein
VPAPLLSVSLEIGDRREASQGVKAEMTMENVLQYVDCMLEELGTYSLPGYAFPMLLIIGLFYLFVGARICKGVIAGLCFIGGCVAGYSFSNSNVVIGVASGIGAAVVALIVQYVVVVILAGLAAGGTAVLVAYMVGQESLAPVFAIGGFLVGAILAVRLYKILLIFATSVLGAACVAACALVLLDETQRPQMTEYLTLGNIELDFHQFSIVFLGLLAAGALVQGITLAYRKAGKEA